MSRRSLFSNRSALSRRVMNMMSSLFRRRWAAPSRVSRRGRLLSRIREMADNFGDVMAQTATRTVTRAARNTHMLTLGAPEFLETRKVMAGFSYNVEPGVLAVWVDTAAEQMTVTSPTGTGDIVVTSDLDGTIFNSYLFSPGSVTRPTELMIYEENTFANDTITLAATQSTTSAGNKKNAGGTGYRQSPTVDLSLAYDDTRATYGQAATAQAYLAPIAVTGTYTGIASGDVLTLSQTLTAPQGAATFGPQTAQITVAIAGGVTTFTFSAVDDRFTDFTSATITKDGTPVTGLTVTGRVSQFTLRNSATSPLWGVQVPAFPNVYSGYYTDVDATFTPVDGAGTGAQRHIDLTQGVAGSTTVAFTPFGGAGGSANPISQTIFVGARDNGAYQAWTGGIWTWVEDTDIDTVTVSTPIATSGSVRFSEVGTIIQTSSITAVGDYLADAEQDIEIYGDVTAAGLVFQQESGGAFGVTMDVGTLRATSSTGDIVMRIEGSDGLIAVGRSLRAGTGQGGGIEIVADKLDLEMADTTVVQAGGLVDFNIAGDIDIRGTGSIQSTLGSVYARSATGDITIVGGGIFADDDTDDVVFIRAPQGDIDLDIGIAATRTIYVEAPTGEIRFREDIDSAGAVYVTSGGNITVDGSLAGATNVSILAGDQITGIGEIVADRLTISALQASGVSLNTSVNSLTSTTDGSVTYRNDKSLSLLGAYFVNAGSLTLITEGASSDLTIASALDLTGWANFTAGRNLNVAGSLTSTGAVELTSKGGTVTAQQISTSQPLTATAVTGIDLSGSVRASAFSLYTDNGNISLRAPANSGNVIVSDAITGSGNVLLTATTGNLVIQNKVATTSGNVTLTATEGLLNITSAANISTADNRMVTTSSKTAKFEAGANITTGTLSYTAGNDAGILNSANASFHTLNAAITGAGNALNVTRSSNLNLTGASTTNAPLNVTLTDGNLNISGAVTAGTGTVTLVVSNGTLTSSGSLSGGTVDATSSNDATFTNALTANATGTVNLTSTAGSINATQTITGKNVTANAAGNLSISGAINGAAGGLANLTSGANLTLSGAVVAGNVTTTTNGSQTISNTINVGTGNIALNATNGAISATQLLTAGNLNVRAQNTSTITTANVSNLTGAITGSGQNLTAGFSNSVAIGAANLTANGGRLDLTLAAGNFTRTGQINSTGGQVAINVGTGSINGTGVINTALLEWTANAAPNATGLNYSALTANMTAVGDLSVERSSSLEVRGITIADGQVNVNVTSGSLTINGPVESRASITNITLAAPAGSINIGDSVGNITANVLDVTAQNAVDIKTNVATLIGNVTSGSFSVTEADGLVIGASGINAGTDNVTITVLEGDLDRSNPITAGTGKVLTLNVPGGSILGSSGVSVDGGTLIWSALNAPLDANLTGQGSYSILSADVTGAGNNLLIQRTGSDLTILRATTLDGVVDIDVASVNNLTINGPVTAGNGNAAYLSAGNAITVTGDNVITAGYLSATAFNNSVLRMNASVFEGDFDQFLLTAVATDSLQIGATNGVTTTGAIDLTVLSGSLDLAGQLNASMASNIAINVAAGGITGSGLITANVLNVASNSTTDIQTRAANLIGDVSSGSLLVAEFDDLVLDSVNAATDISINADAGNITGDGLVVAGQNVTLNASAGNITLNTSANQVSAGDLLTLTANSTSDLNTAVGSLAATILADSESLTIVEGDDLVIAGAGILANGAVSIQAGNLNFVSGLNAGTGDVTLNLSGGSTGAGVVAGNMVTLNAVTDSSLATTVGNIAADVTSGSLAIVETDDLSIDSLNAATSLSVQAGNAIEAVGALNAGTNLTMNATTSISGAGAVTAGNDITLIAGTTIMLNTPQQIDSTSNGLLTITAGNDVNLDVNVGSLAANITGGNLTLSEADGLSVMSLDASGDVVLAVVLDDLTIDGDVTAANVEFSADAGNITGTNLVTASANIALNAGMAVTLNGTSQLTGNVLTITAVDSSELGTNVSSLDAVLSGVSATLDVVETAGLSVINANAPGGVNITLAAGDLDGSGVIDAGTSEAILNIAGSVNLTTNATNPQVVAGDLHLTAGGSAALNVAIDSLNASVTGGNLTLSDAGDLLLDGFVSVPGNVANLTVAGDITGAGLLTANEVVLSANMITLTDPAQIVATIARITTLDAADVNIDVQNLVANVGGALNVVEAGDLFIGVVAGDEVRAGSLNVTVTSGNLSGPGDINVTGDVDLQVQDASNGSVTLTAGQVRADNLTVSAQAGSIDLNTAVANLTATTLQDTGYVAVTQTGDLTVLVIDTVDGNADVTVSAGNLTIGSVAGDDGILGGQLSNVTLSATSGFVSTAAGAGVFGNVLNVTAQNSSELNTTVTTLVANITGSGESLTISEFESLSDPDSIDGLTIGLAGVVTNGGDISINLVNDPANIAGNGNIVGGNLVLTGPITAGAGDITLDVVNGSVTGAGLISGDFLNVAAQNTTSLNTSVATLSANITSGTLTVSEADGLVIDFTNGVIAQNVAVSLTGTGDLNIAGDINATTGNLDLDTAEGDIFGIGNVNSAANVTLVANGTIELDSSASQVTGNVLEVDATANASLNTAVNSVFGNVSGDFTLNEADDLVVNAAGIDVALGNLNVVLATGNLTGTGLIDVDGDISLNASLGNVTLTQANQVTATGNLALVAQDTSAVNTNVSGVEANVTAGLLTIVEADGLEVLANGVLAENVSLTLLTQGDLNMTGDINAILGDVTIVVNDGSVLGAGNVVAAENIAINASDSVTLATANQVTGNVLNLVAGLASDLGTNINGVFANVATGLLQISEFDDLTVRAAGTANGVAAGNVTISAGGDLSLAGNVTGRSGDINLTVSSGNITGPGSVNATGDIVLSAIAGNVTLNGINQVSGDDLTLFALNDSAVNTVVTTIVANVTSGSLTVVEATDLLVESAGINAADNVSLTLSNGSLTGGNAFGGNITAGDTVNLVVNGTIDFYGLSAAGPGFIGAISAVNLVVDSQNASIDTNVTTLIADITGDLEINEQDGLTIGTDVNATGSIVIAADGLIDGLGNVNSATGNVTLTSVSDGITLNTTPSQVSGNVLSVIANMAVDIESNVTSLIANVTSFGESLTINEATSLTIDGGNVVTNDGDINITVGGALVRSGNIDAGTADITLTAANGITGFGQIIGNDLVVAAADASTLNTSVNTINAVLSGSAASLVVVESDSLTVVALETNDGNIDVTVGGNLDGSGAIDAGTANITLNAASGDIDLTGTITANVLTINAQDGANLTTDVTAINATVASGSLTLDEIDDLRIIGLAIGGNINLTVGGDIDGPGTLSANGGNANVTLNAVGGITLSGANQIVGNVLNITAGNSSSLGTKVNTLVANITGSGESLTVVENDGLTIGAANVITTNGNVSITSGSLVLAGGIDAGTANVALSVTGTVSGSGTIVADQLDLTSTGNVAVTTLINSLNAAVTAGSLAVNDADDLTIVNATASGDISLNAPSGTLNGTGPVNSTSGNVSLTATTIDLTAVNQVRGNVLSVNVTGSADINSAVSTVVASNIGTNLNLVEADGLAVGAAGIVGTDAALNIVSGGSLTLTGGIDVRSTGSVDLRVSGGISGSGQIKADVLNVTATQSSALNTSVNNLSANVTTVGQSLTITEADGLTITGDNVRTNNGPISITLAAGDLDIEGVLSAGGGSFATITLNVAGAIDTNGLGSINGTTLQLRAGNTSDITTNVGVIAATITGSGQGLTITETDDLTVSSAGGIVANGGDVVVNVGSSAVGSLLLSGPVNAGAGNVTLIANRAISGAGLVTGNILTVQVERSASINSNVTAVQGEITGTTQTLTVTDASGLNIGPDSLYANGTNSKVVLTANGSIGGDGSIFATSGLSNVTLNATGGIAMTGDIDAGSQGTVVLLSGGTTVMNATRQITADTLVLNSAGSANVGTDVANLSAVVGTANATLTVSEYDGLRILPSGAVTNRGAIKITAGTGATGDLVIAGPVNAVLNTVTLSSISGGISTTGSGLITGGNLFITSLENVALATNVTGLAAIVSDPGQTLTINEANGLVILNAGNVVQTTDGDITITLAAGSLSGAGTIEAGLGNVTLNASAGAITLTAANQVRGALLTATANGSSALNTAVDNLAITLGGAGQTLTIVEADDVSIDGVATSNGNVSIRSLTGAINGTGNLSAGTANVSLNANTSIDLLGTITANQATLLASGGDLQAVTNVTSLSANAAAGSIVIDETSGLTLLAAGLNAATDITVNVASGVLNGTGNVVASNLVTLNAAGGTTLTTRASQVRADSLLVQGGTSTINTSINNLAATMNGSLTVTEANGLAIDPDVDTSVANGDVRLNVRLGNLEVNSDINAGTGTITLNVPTGNIAGSGTVTANHLIATSRTGIDLETNVSLLNAVVTVNGNITINETNDLTVLTATSTRGNISLTAGGDIETRTVTARAGSIDLTADNVVINGSLSTSSTLDLSGVTGNVTVLGAGRITTGRTAGSVINQSSGNGVIWSVDDTANAGNGTLRQAITGVNGFQGKSQLGLSGISGQNITLTQQLPTVARGIHIAGNNVGIIGAGGNRFTGLTLTGNSNVSDLRFENFGGPALYMVGGRSAAVDIDVSNLSIKNSTIGIQAVNLLNGSTIANSSIIGSGLARTYGIMLSSARGLTFSTPQTTISNVAVGVSATGILTGTTVSNVSIDAVRAAPGYGISLVSARSLTVAQATTMISQTNIGIFASGFCTGSDVGATFGAGVTTRLNVRNSRNLIVR